MFMKINNFLIGSLHVPFSTSCDQSVFEVLLLTWKEVISSTAGKTWMDLLFNYGTGNINQ